MWFKLTIPRPSSICFGPKRSDVTCPGNVQTESATPIVPTTSDACFASAATSARDKPASAAAPATCGSNKLNIKKQEEILQESTDRFMFDIPAAQCQNLFQQKKNGADWSDYIRNVCLMNMQYIFNAS